MKEIKVKKSRNEDDNYVELWKVYLNIMEDTLTKMKEPGTMCQIR